MRIAGADADAAEPGISPQRWAQVSDSARRILRRKHEEEAKA